MSSLEKSFDCLGIKEDDDWEIIDSTSETVPVYNNDYHRATFDQDFGRVLIPKEEEQLESGVIGFVAYDLQNKSDLIRRVYGTPGSAVLISQSHSFSQVALVVDPHRDVIVFVDKIDAAVTDYNIKKTSVCADILRIQLCTDKFLVVSTSHKLLVLAVPHLIQIHDPVVNDEHTFAACKGIIAYTQSKINGGNDVHILDCNKRDPRTKFTVFLPKPVDHMCFDDSASILAIASKDGYTIRVHEVATKNILHVLHTTYKDTVVQSMTISRSHLVVTTDKKGVLVYNVTRGFSELSIICIKAFKLYDEIFDDSYRKKEPCAIMEVPEDQPVIPVCGNSVYPKNGCIRKITDDPTAMQGLVTYNGWTYLYDIMDKDENKLCKLIGKHRTE